MRDTAFDVTFDSQIIFRSLLDAMARPGSIVVLPDININLPVMNQYPLLLLMTLLDHEVSFCVSGHDDANVNVNRQAVAEYLRSNTGSKESALRDADFILVCEGSSHGLIRRAKQGTLEYPDESATVVYDVGSIGDSGSEGDGSHEGDMLAELSGPGIAGKCIIAISGMEQAEIEDVLSDRNGNIACIPRSTNVRVM